MEITEEYELPFTLCGKKIKLGIKNKIKELNKEIERIHTKALKNITHPKLKTILEHEDEIYLLFPTEIPENLHPEEAWKGCTVDEEKYRKQITAVQIVEMYHELRGDKIILETLYRHLEPEKEYDLTTSQLVLFGL